MIFYVIWNKKEPNVLNALLYVHLSVLFEVEEERLYLGSIGGGPLEFEAFIDAQGKGKGGGGASKCCIGRCARQPGILILTS